MLTKRPLDSIPKGVEGGPWVTPIVIVVDRDSDPDGGRGHTSDTRSGQQAFGP